MELPRRDGNALVAIFPAAVALFVGVAIVNLINYDSTPFYAIILSIVWLLIVSIGLVFSIEDNGGFGFATLEFLSGFSSRQFVEVIQECGDPVISFRFELLFRTLTRLKLRSERISSIEWSSGQGTSLAGQDMNDWTVVLRYKRGSRKHRKDSGAPKRELLIIGPSGPKDDTVTLGESLARFLRSNGVDIHATEKRRVSTQLA